MNSEGQNAQNNNAEGGNQIPHGIQSNPLPFSQQPASGPNIGLTTLNYSEVMLKLKSRKQWVDFSEFCGFWFPDDDSYTIHFLSDWFRGKKRLLKLEQAVSCKIRKLKLCKVSQKETLTEYCYESQEISQYLPDKSRSKKISRDTLLTLIYALDREYFNKIILKTRSVSALSLVGKEKETITVSNQMKQSLNNYISMYKSTSNRGASSSIFKRLNQENADQ